MIKRISVIVSGGLLAARIMAQAPAPGPAPDWEAVLPPQAGVKGRVEFIGALEAGNGDLYVAGRDAGAELVVRLEPGGRVRWAGRYPFAGASASAFIGLRETSLGLVSLWGCCGQPGWTAMRHDDMGGLAGRADIGYARGMLDVSPSARVIFLSNGQNGTRRFPIYAESRGLAGQADWKTLLAEGDLHEVIGIRAMGDSSVSVLDRMGGYAGDTLMVRMLDAAGQVVWSRDVPTGAKVPGYPDNHSVIWTALETGPDGRIVLAGIVVDFSDENTNPDSLALAIFSRDGDLLRLGRVPLRLDGEPFARGFWEVVSLSPEAGGIRVGLFRQGGRRFWSKLEIPWTAGEGRFLSRSPPIGDAWFHRASAMGSGTFIGFGAVAEPSGIPSPDRLDSAWRPTGLSVPALFDPIDGLEGKWRTRVFPQYADTTRVRLIPSPMGPAPDYGIAPGLDFLLPTRDGGALAGGRLWRRGSQDTLAVIAIKIPPAGVRALQPRGPIRRRRAIPTGNLPDGFDATGRWRGIFLGPLFNRPGATPVLPPATAIP